VTQNQKKVAALTVEELKFIIDDIIDAKLLEWFGDPDEGLELKPEIIKRLKRNIKLLRSGKLKTIPLEEVARKHGIKLKE